MTTYHFKQESTQKGAACYTGLSWLPQEPWAARAFEQKLKPQEKGQPQGREADTGRAMDRHQGPMSSVLCFPRASHTGPSSMGVSWGDCFILALDQGTRAVPKPEVTNPGDWSKGAPSRASHAQNTPFTLNHPSCQLAGHSPSRANVSVEYLESKKHLSQWYILISRNGDV